MPTTDRPTSDPRADLRWGTTSALLSDAAARLGSAEAVVDGTDRWTYAGLDAHVTRLARSFLAAGLVQGDRVAVWGPNSGRWIVTALALQRAGGVLVPLNTRFKPAEAAYILAKSGTRMLVVTGEFLGRDYAAGLAHAAGPPDGELPFAGLPLLETVVLMDGEPTKPVLSWTRFEDLGETVDEEDVLRRAAATGPDDLSDMLFTSGTTGHPKGAMCTHGQTLRAYAVWAQVVGLRAGDRYLVVNPFFHGFGYKAGWLASLIVGATVLPERTLDVPHVLKVVREQRVTVLPGTPTLYQTMLEHPDFSAADVARLRLAVTGAASVAPSLLARVKREIGFEHIVTGYGLTESCAIVSMCRYDDPPEVVATTCGHPLPGLEVAVLDPGGAALPVGSEGEIVVRGYTVMKGYFGNESETAATIDANGWLHTGDIGLLDADGRLRITDRMKDMYIVGGFNAYPAEIERMLDSHPGIARSAVVGVPDERMGEVGAAFVVPRRDTTLDPDEVIGWAKESMANYKVPRQVHVVADLPVNASGKVLKGELRERLASPSTTASAASSASQS
ncbi:FadD3 family acyl-CoA ligase [Streptomyces sp. NPDC091292]|uniref:FadD3 family acyl-CoA ligase n=1 Tax=Streptomyces sp. NPDC091292 TaxID=3365991 RepID=UPI0038039406